MKSRYIFIHGLGQSSSSWNKTTSYLAKQEPIICPDLSLLLKEGEVTYGNLYQKFAEGLDEISEPLNLCGLSLGGVMALNYAIDYPQKVKSLVLIAAQYEMPKILLKLQNVVFRFIPETSFTNIGMRKKDFITLTNSMMNLNFSNSLKDITCPVLVICGEKDHANKKAAKNLAECIKEARLHFVKNARHEVNSDAPQELAELLNDFYNR